MRSTPRTTTTSRAHRSIRVRGWLYLRALTLGPAIGILLGSPAAVGLTADAVAASPAHTAVAVSRVEAAASPSTGAGVFGGFTSKGGPVVVELTRNGKQIKRVVAGIELRCSSGGTTRLICLPLRVSRSSVWWRGSSSDAARAARSWSRTSGQSSPSGAAASQPRSVVRPSRTASPTSSPVRSRASSTAGGRASPARGMPGWWSATRLGSRSSPATQGRSASQHGADAAVISQLCAAPPESRAGPLLVESG